MIELDENGRRTRPAAVSIVDVLLFWRQTHTVIITSSKMLVSAPQDLSEAGK